MAGFFSLGGGGRSQSKAAAAATEEEEEQREDHHHNNARNNTTTSQFLLRNQEIYNRGFEIWPQSSSSSYHHNNNNSNLHNYYSFGVGPSRRNNNNDNTAAAAAAINDDVSVSFSDESNRFGFTVMRSSSGSGGGMNCQDCGNQAKKDCTHLRCRTCCKSRGFPCQTHVKSTWVPAAKRRERQQQLSSLQQQQQNHQHQFRAAAAGPSADPSKRHRDADAVAVASASLASAPVPITTTGLELGQFPPELNSPAVFRCVKVSAMDAADERYAYQTAVNIGGHVFKGILYDQGADNPYASGGGGEGSSGGGESHNPPLNLISNTSTATNPYDSSLYTAPLSAFMAGTQFFPPPRS